MMVSGRDLDLLKGQSEIRGRCLDAAAVRQPDPLAVPQSEPVGDSEAG